MRRITVLLITLAAIAFVAAPASGAVPAPRCLWRGPVVTHNPGGAVIAEKAAGRTACGARIDEPVSETNIAVTPKGTVLFSPARTENSLARSTDGGATWSLTYPQEMQYTSLWNTVDPMLTVDRDTGRAFWVHATGATRTLPVLVSQSPLPSPVPTIVAAAYGFQVYASSDEGRTWTTADYQSAPIGDWEKIMVGPPRTNASQEERPVGYPNVVYVCGNSPFEVTGPGRLCYRSLDGGKTFQPVGYVTPSPNMPADAWCPPLASNSGVVGPDGAVYQPISCSGGAYVAVSEDEGASYVFRAVKDAPPSNGISGSLQLAMDSGGTLYAEWVRDDQLQYAVSRNQGQTWGAPLTISAPGMHQIMRPAPAAGRRGEFGVAYYGSTDPKAEKLTLYVTQTANALESKPVLSSAALSDPGHPMYADAGVTGASPRADYIGAAFDSGGTLWAGGVEQLAPPDAANRQLTTGYVGRIVASPEPQAKKQVKKRRCPAGRHRNSNGPCVRAGQSGAHRAPRQP
jgi:hypothetical protein